MGEEVEIKLLCGNEEILEELFRCPEIAPFLVSPPREIALRAFYLDTPDLRLVGERIAYRIREEGAQWVATVKTGKVKTPEGLYVRGEWEREVPGPDADPAVFRETEIGDRLMSLVKDKPLVVLFEIRVTRALGLLRFPDGSEIELAADRGEIQCHHLRAPILEVELELKKGSRARLTALSNKLQSIFPLTPGTGSKYARGLALFRRAGRGGFPAGAFFASING